MVLNTAKISRKMGRGEGKKSLWMTRLLTVLGEISENDRKRSRSVRIKEEEMRRKSLSSLPALLLLASRDPQCLDHLLSHITKLGPWAKSTVCFP